MSAVLQICFLLLTLINYGHSNIIKYCNRPFSNIGEHDNTLIENHNSLIRNKDFVIHLGDFSFPKNIENILSKLNGKIIIVFGNHDKHLKSKDNLFFKSYDGIYELKHPSKIICCHYPLLSWNGAFHGTSHVFGHVHSSPEKHFVHQPNSYDVGVDNNNMKPISYEDLIIKLEESKKLPLING